MKLTAMEAGEVYYCLIDKLARVMRGDYSFGDEKYKRCQTCLDKKDRVQKTWIKDLEDILTKIGPDGKNLQK